MRRFILLVVTIMIVLSLSMPAYAEPDKYIYDHASLFNEDQCAELEEKAKGLFKSYDAEFYLVTVDIYRYTGEDFCYENGIDMDTDNVIIMVINASDPKELYYDIYTYGNAYDKISDSEIDHIVYHDEVYGNLKSNVAFDGAMAYFNYSSKAYGGHLAAPASDIIVTSLLIGVAVALIVCISVYANYKTKEKSVKYPLSKYAKLSLTEEHDIFVGKNVTRTRIQSSSGGGGRSGGSGHGGGRGHRGGA